MMSDQTQAGEDDNRHRADELEYRSPVPLPNHRDKESQFAFIQREPVAAMCPEALTRTPFAKHPMLQFQDMENSPSPERGSNTASRESVCEGGEVSWCAPVDDGIRSN